MEMVDARKMEGANRRRNIEALIVCVVVVVWCAEEVEMQFAMRVRWGILGHVPNLCLIEFDLPLIWRYST